jgi:hypothetical protein
VVCRINPPSAGVHSGTIKAKLQSNGQVIPGTTQAITYDNTPCGPATATPTTMP